MEASQHVYVVKVRALPDPALLFPSERRYSALTVGGIAAGHALLGCVAILLGALALSWGPPQGSWFGHLGAGLWLGAAALQASLCGMLAWRRWYEDRYITWFFRSSLLAAFVAGAGLVLTSAALAHLHENVLSLVPEQHQHPLFVHDDNALGVLGASVAAEEGSGGGSPSWLDLADLPLPDANSSTISSGGVFSDLVRDQDHDLLAADSTRHDDVDVASQEHPDTTTDHSSEWSVLRWVPVPISPRASAQIRSLVAVNVLVACFLELLWSLLGARLAWRGMQAADVDTGPGPAHGPPTTASSATTLALPAAELERGAADGKVDVDAELKKELADGKERQARMAASRAILQRRRRAPELPELEQRTMNLEERVARLLDADVGHVVSDRNTSEQTNGQA